MVSFICVKNRPAMHPLLLVMVICTASQIQAFRSIDILGSYLSSTFLIASKHMLVSQLG